MVFSDTESNEEDNEANDVLDNLISPRQDDDLLSPDAIPECHSENESDGIIKIQKNENQTLDNTLQKCTKYANSEVIMKPNKVVPDDFLTQKKSISED